MLRSKIICFYGLPHSGKSTLASQLSRLLEYKNIDLGDLLRSIISSGQGHSGYTQVKLAVEANRLISEELAIELISEQIKYSKSVGFCIVGFPRTLKSTELFETLIQQNNISKSEVLVVNISIDPKESVRLSLIRQRANETDIAAVQRKIHVYETNDRVVLEILKTSYRFLELEFNNGPTNNLETLLSELA